MSSFGIQMVVYSLLMMGIITVAGNVYSKKKLLNKDSFFTAGRNVTTAFMTATFIAFAVGTGLIFSPGEMAYYEGLTAMIGYALAISIAYIIFIPIAGRIKELIPEGHTIGEYTKARYGKTMQAIVLCVTIVYMFILFTANLIGAGIAFKYLGGMPIYVGVLIVGIPTVIYTTYGGLGAAIFTNAIQAILLTPLLILTAAIALNKSGGATGIYEGVMQNNAAFLNVFHASGFQFALLIIIAVSSAELLNQALWQRVYSSKSVKVIKRSLLSAAIMIFPMTVMAASFGLIAISRGMELPHPSIATALVSHALLPEWASLLFIMVIVLAATSTGANALTGFSAIASFDLIKTFWPNMSAKSALIAGKIGIVIFGLGAMLIAFQAPSILFLLLLADLGAAAAVVPILAGLYKDYITGKLAVTGTILGIAFGMPLFVMGMHFYSFITAIIVSSFVVFFFGRFSKKKYDFSSLKETIKSID